MAYFEGARRGEMRELHEALNSRSLDDKKTALKKVIAQMTIGKDLSELFQPVIKCLEFNDLEIKKLVTIVPNVGLPVRDQLFAHEARRRHYVHQSLPKGCSEQGKFLAASTGRSNYELSASTQTQ
jgi:hypothetical protein